MIGSQKNPALDRTYSLLGDMLLLQFNQKVDWFSQGFRLLDNYSDDGVSSQRNNEDQAVSKGFPDFFCCRIAGAAPWLRSIHRCIQVVRHCCLVSQ